VRAYWTFRGQHAHDGEVDPIGADSSGLQEMVILGPDILSFAVDSTSPVVEDGHEGEYPMDVEVESGGW